MIEELASFVVFPTSSLLAGWIWDRERFFSVEERSELLFSNL
jgi:hypothetical protein